MSFYSSSSLIGEDGANKVLDIDYPSLLFELPLILTKEYLLSQIKGFSADLGLIIGGGVSIISVVSSIIWTLETDYPNLLNYVNLAPD